MSNRKQEQIDSLMECVHVEVSIECSNDGCNSSETDYYGDDYISAQEFYKKGWRVDKDGNAVCPKCLTKNKKKK